VNSSTFKLLGASFLACRETISVLLTLKFKKTQLSDYLVLKTEVWGGISNWMKEGAVGTLILLMEDKLP